MSSSTFRSANEQTIGEAGWLRPNMQQVISTEWLQSGQVDLAAALRRHPLLLRDRSLLLDLAIKEYQAQRQNSSDLDLEQHCQRFEEFGSSIHRSILRQLEAQRYLDDHPELLELLCTPQWPQPGVVFGGFQVVEELGFGATAHVYLCREQEVGNRQVVVKATPYSSFEASILGRLNHPNIIPIYSTGVVEERNLHYLCMPYCGRSTLADLLDLGFDRGCPRHDTAIALAARRWLKDQPPPTERRSLGDWLGRSYVDGVLALAAQIADALEHAHRHHILHGDLKPSNVLLTPDGRPLLLDFNLSQDYGASSAMCGGGTLPYMPPEHLRIVAGGGDQPAKTAFDPRTDVYSFGAVLYELLSGRTPVAMPRRASGSAGIAKELLRRLQRGVPPIRGRNPLVSRRLEALVLRCLAFEPDARPASMAAVRQALQAERRSLAVVGRLARVRPLLFSLVVGLPLATGIGAAAWYAAQPPRYLRDYHYGLELANAGNLDQSHAYLSAAVEANPAFKPARFELARAKIKLSDLDGAMTDFRELAQHGDVKSMAYMGYCFNLRKLPIPAIPWYERALSHGKASAAIYNNLGASYVDALGGLPNVERIKRAEQYLMKALEIDSASAVIKLNVVRLADARSRLDEKYNPFSVWYYAAVVLAALPDDTIARVDILNWYDAVAQYERRVPQHGNDSLSNEAIEARSRFGSVSSEAERSNSRQLLDRYYLEPLWPADAKQP